MRAVDLYKISAAGTTYLLTSAAKTQTYLGDDYLPAPISRGGTQTKGELSKANLDVTLPLGHALAVQLMTEWSEQIVTITVWRKRTLGTDVIWKGRLAATEPDDTRLKMVFESIFTSMRRPGLRARFQKTCRHPLYGAGCYLDYHDWGDAAVLTDISGLTLTVEGAEAREDGYYTGGMIAAPDGSLSYVTSHVGTQLTLTRLAYPLQKAYTDEVAAQLPDSPALAVTIYPGCPHDYITCRDRFSNDDNYGGFDYIPTKNPMGGSSIV